MTENDDEVYPIGLDINLNSTNEINFETYGKQPASPLVICLGDTGYLSTFFAIKLDNKQSICTPANKLTFKKIEAPTQPSSQPAPAINLTQPQLPQTNLTFNLGQSQIPKSTSTFNLGQTQIPKPPSTFNLAQTQAPNIQLGGSNVMSGSIFPTSKPQEPPKPFQTETKISLGQADKVQINVPQIGFSLTASSSSNQPPFSTTPQQPVVQTLSFTMPKTQTPNHKHQNPKTQKFNINKFRIY